MGNLPMLPVPPHDFGKSAVAKALHANLGHSRTAFASPQYPPCPGALSGKASLCTEARGRACGANVAMARNAQKGTARHRRPQWQNPVR